METEYKILDEFLTSKNIISSLDTIVLKIKNGYIKENTIYFNDENKKITYSRGLDLNKYLKHELPSFEKIPYVKPTKKSNKSIFIFKVSSNFLHFIYDSLTQILIFKAASDFFKQNGKKLVLVTNVKQLKKWLSILDDLEKIIDFSCLDDMLDIGLINCKNFHEYENILYFPHKFKVFRHFPIFQKTYDDFINLVNEYVTKNYQKDYYDRIYISRRIRKGNQTICDGRRNLINENQMVKYVENKKFVEIWLEDYSFFEKIAILNSAKIIILQSSAPCILLPFVRNKTIILLKSAYKIGPWPPIYEKYFTIYHFQGDYNPNKLVNNSWRIDMAKFDMFFSEISDELNLI